MYLCVGLSGRSWEGSNVGVLGVRDSSLLKEAVEVGLLDMGR